MCCCRVCGLDLANVLSQGPQHYSRARDGSGYECQPKANEAPAIAAERGTSEDGRAGWLNSLRLVRIIADSPAADAFLRGLLKKPP